jgi:hypothetical protein
MTKNDLDATPETDQAEIENMKLQFFPGRVLTSFARDLEKRNNRMRWVMQQLALSLPEKRDWLNPDLEREIYMWAENKNPSKNV